METASGRNTGNQKYTQRGLQTIWLQQFRIKFIGWTTVLVLLPQCPIHAIPYVAIDICQICCGGRPLKLSAPFLQPLLDTFLLPYHDSDLLKRNIRLYHREIARLCSYDRHN